MSEIGKCSYKKCLALKIPIFVCHLVYREALTKSNWRLLPQKCLFKCTWMTKRIHTTEHTMFSFKICYFKELNIIMVTLDLSRNGAKRTALPNSTSKKPLMLSKWSNFLNSHYVIVLMGHPRPIFFHFRSFQSRLINWQQIHVISYPPCIIWCWDLSTIIRGQSYKHYNRNLQF